MPNNDDWSVETLSGKGGISMSRSTAVEVARGENSTKAPAVASQSGPGLLDRAKNALRSIFGGEEPAANVISPAVIPKQAELPKSPVQMRIFSGVDNVKGNEFAVKEGGHAPPLPTINADNNSGQINHIFREWLAKTDTLPPDYADKFLREPDNNRVFRDKIAAMFEKQDDPDARAYGKEFLENMDKIRDQWISARIEESKANPSISVTPDFAPKP